MYYRETETPDIDADSRSLTVAFANLLQKMGSEYQLAPTELHDIVTSDDPNVDWWSLSDYIEDIGIKEVLSDEDAWPNTSDAILKFRRVDEAAAGIVDHYCVIADHTTRSIIDSTDGVIKTASTYGQVVGWASYTLITPDAQFDEDEPNTYTLKEGENLWDAGRAVNISVDDLILLNSIDEPRDVKAGYKLLLPIPEDKPKDTIRYEVLPEPVPMHITKGGGTKKFMFGNASSWNDIDHTGRTHHESSNHMIYAIAHVELVKEGMTAAYYMDRIDLGNYETLGRPQFLTGFNHSHMAEGHFKPAEAPVVSPVIAEALKEMEPALEVAKEAVHAPKVMDIVSSPVAYQPFVDPTEDYRNTLIPLNDDGHVVTFMAQETLTVHEVARRRPARPLYKGQSVKISHTFEKDNTLFGLPAGTKDSPFWFGIPMDKLISEEELYNFNIPLNERLAMNGKLSAQERMVVFLSKLLSRGTRLKTIITRK